MNGGALALAPVIAGVAVGASALTVLAFWAFEHRDDPRRRWLGFGVVAVGLIAYGAYVFGALVAPRIVVLTERTVATAAWRGPPLRIAVVAAPEFGPQGLSSQEFLRLVGRINRAGPDLVVVLGNLTHPMLPLAEMEQRFAASLSLAALARLEAPLGVVAVLGSADAALSREDVARDLEDAGVAVLWNRSVVVDRVGAPFLIAGWAPGGEAAPALAQQGGPPEAPVLTIATGDARRLPTHAAAVTILANRACARRHACVRGPRDGAFVLETAGLHGGGLSPPEIVLITLRAEDPS